MKTMIFILIVLFLECISYGQNKIDPPTKTAREECGDQVYNQFTVDDNPKMIGGVEAFKSRLGELARTSDFKSTGNIFVVAVIDRNGQVLDAKILKGKLNNILTEKLLEFIRKTPFEPGKKNGKTVCVDFRFPPIKFLNN